MDNLAHTLVGAALGRAVADRKVPGAALIGAIAANAPDWTELFIGLPGWSRSEYLVQHRGLTHALGPGLLEIAALTLLIGLGARWWTRRRGGTPPPWGGLALCVAVTVLSHFFMDWQGSYGWRPFLPWNGTWYYGDWVAIVDPFFWMLPLMALAWGAERHWIPLAISAVVVLVITYFIVRAGDVVAPWLVIAFGTLCVIAAVGWLRYWVGPVGRRRAAAVAVGILALYAGAHGAVAQVRKDEVREEAQRRFGPDARAAALTNVGRPFTWDAIYASHDSVAGDAWRQARNLDLPLVIEVLRATPEGDAMKLFARFLAADVDSTAGGGGGVTVYLRDARYARTLREGWAVLRVRMD